MKTKVALIAVLGLLLAVAAQAVVSFGFFRWGYEVVDEENYPADFLVDESPSSYIADFSAQFRVHSNPDRENVKLYLPLPANRRMYQRILSYKVEPEPTRIIQSRYGYQIAEFDFGPLAADAPFGVRYHADLELFDVRIPLDPEQVGTLDDIPEQIRRDYTVNGPFYRVDDPYIREVLDQAIDDEQNLLLQVRNIWMFVRKRLYYFGDGRKDTAPKVLQQGHGTCTEYSFSMIAMCRAAGIPARYMSGSLTKASDMQKRSRDTVFHKIVEVYLPKVGWVPMESTSGGRYVDDKVADQQIGRLRPRMLFYVVETEPGLVPIDPRRNTVTWINTRSRTRVGLTGQVFHLWERVKNPRPESEDSPDVP